jgi:phage terminase large subunit-like protein
VSAAAALRRLRASPLARYTPGPPHLAFLEDPARFRLLRAPSQSGKTLVAAYETVNRCLGRHPHQRTQSPPIEVRVLCHSFRQSVVVQAKVHAFLTPQMLSRDCSFHPVRGFKHNTVSFNNGSRIVFVTAEQDRLALASATLDVVWVDEPPTETAYAESASRLVQTGGSMYLTLTPVGRPVAWLKDEVTRGVLSETHFSLSVQACPWMSEAQVEEAINVCLPSQRSQVIGGAWEADSLDRYFASWDPSMVSEDMPTGEVEIGLGIDHGEDAGKECALLIAVERSDRQHPRIWFLDEYVSPGHTGIDADAMAILDMIERAGLQPEAVDVAVGDHNSAGKSQAGYGINALMTESLARQCGRPESSPPFRIGPARKGPGSVIYTSRLLHAAMVKGDLKVHPRCKNLVNGFRHWRGPGGDSANRELTHALDAARYIGRSFLDTRSGGLQSLRVR